jgi:hypothetical protein
MMWLARSDTTSSSTSGWQARVACTFTESRLVQMVHRSSPTGPGRGF